MALLKIKFLIDSLLYLKSEYQQSLIYNIKYSYSLPEPVAVPFGSTGRVMNRKKGQMHPHSVVAPAAAEKLPFKAGCPVLGGDAGGASHVATTRGFHYAGVCLGRCAVWKRWGRHR